MKLSDPYNVSTFSSRANGVTLIFGILFLILLTRLWYLQIWRGEEFRAFSDRNRFRLEKLSAPRGPLFDRNGKLIADSRPRFDLLLTRGYTPDLERELLVIQDILRWTREELMTMSEKIKRAGRYQEVVLAEDLTFDQLALIESQNLELEGIEIRTESVRDYLYGDTFFHALGYTREVGENDLKGIQKRYPASHYQRGDQVGIKGIEALYENFLRGRDGKDFTVVDVKGRRIDRNEWRLLPQVPRLEPQSGTGLKLAIDLDLQREAQSALIATQHSGAVVALDPRNGEVLAMVSVPSLDPNAFTRMITSKQLAAWSDQNNKPFLDRSLGEHYVPGSTFKLVMAAAALEQGVVDGKTTFFCPGYYRFGNRTWKCHAKEGHGSVNMIQAIERSCDVYFYNIGLRTGLDSIYSWATRFGFGRRSFIGHEAFSGRLENLFRFNSEQPGFLPNLDWVLAKRRTTVEAEILNASIGQGAVTVTVMQLARMVAAITNGGKIMQPQLVLSSLDAQANEVQRFKARLENSIDLKASTTELVLRGMEEVIQGAQGTARGSRLPNILYGGKTGTAQVAALELTKQRAHVKSLQDHALFVAAAPSRNPELAIAVIVENGGHGSSAAAPVARKMIEVYFKNRPQTEGASHAR